MGISNKFLVAGATACALAATPIAVAAVGPTATTTPTHPKLGASVAMTLKGMKAGEKIKAAELAPFGQKRTLYPAKRVNAAGTIVVTVKAQVKGKHTWTFTGRTSRKTVKTSYVVK